MKTNQSGDVTEYDGLVFDILKQIAEILNFTIKVETLSKWNSNPNATMLSMNNTNRVLTNQIPDVLLEMVKNRTVAFGACAVTITRNLKQHINYTIPISSQAYALLVARPKELSRALLFISPFTGDVSSKRKLKCHLEKLMS